MKRSLLLAALVLFPIPVQAQVDRATLTAGTYTVAAEAQHFGTQSRAAILDAGQQARIDFSLMVGGVSEAVTVAEATRLLDTTQAAVGSVIDQSAVSRTGSTTTRSRPTSRS